jgi:DNA adenine methylase
MEVKRPLLRWHGGKWMLADWILEHFPKHRIYTETFAGAASVLMKKPKAYAEVLNDLDGNVVNLFRVLRDKALGPELIHQLEMTPFARQEFKESYEPTDDPLEGARRFVVLSFQGFGSDAGKKSITTGFRSNSNRSGTTPAHDWRNYPSALPGIIERLSDVIIENRPAIQILKQHDSPETLHYVDPPYVQSTRTTKNGKNYHGYTHEMSEDDHRELAGTLKGLKGMVVLSGYPSELYKHLYSDWTVSTKKTFADGAKERVEILWMNEAVSENLQGKLL